MTTEDQITVRRAVDDDFDSILEIWLEGIGDSFGVSLADVTISENFRRVFEARDPVFDFWVARDGGSHLLGWQSLAPTTSNPLKRHLYAESSTYVRADSRARGAGEALVREAIRCASATSLQYLCALIKPSNTAIRAIARSTGWTELGEFPPSSKGRSAAKIYIVRAL